MSAFTERYIRTISKTITNSDIDESLYTVPEGNTFIAFSKYVSGGSSGQSGTAGNGSSASNTGDDYAFSISYAYSSVNEEETERPEYEGDYRLAGTYNGSPMYASENRTLFFNNGQYFFGYYDTDGYIYDGYAFSDSGLPSSLPIESLLGPIPWYYGSTNSPLKFHVQYTPLQPEQPQEPSAEIKFKDSAGITSIVESGERVNVKERYEENAPIIVNGTAGATASIIGILYRNQQDGSLVPVQFDRPYSRMRVTYSDSVSNPIPVTIEMTEQNNASGSTRSWIFWHYETLATRLYYDENCWRLNLQTTYNNGAFGNDGFSYRAQSTADRLPWDASLEWKSDMGMNSVVVFEDAT